MAGFGTTSADIVDKLKDPMSMSMEFGSNLAEIGLKSRALDLQEEQMKREAYSRDMDSLMKASAIRIEADQARMAQQVDMAKLDLTERMANLDREADMAKAKSAWQLDAARLDMDAAKMPGLLKNLELQNEQAVRDIEFRSIQTAQAKNQLEEYHLEFNLRSVERQLKEAQARGDLASLPQKMALQDVAAKVAMGQFDAEMETLQNSFMYPKLNRITESLKAGNVVEARKMWREMAEKGAKSFGLQLDPNREIGVEDAAELKILADTAKYSLGFAQDLEKIDRQNSPYAIANELFKAVNTTQGTVGAEQDKLATGLGKTISSMYGYDPETRPADEAFNMSVSGITAAATELSNTYNIDPAAVTNLIANDFTEVEVELPGEGWMGIADKNVKILVPKGLDMEALMANPEDYKQFIENYPAAIKQLTTQLMLSKMKLTKRANIQDFMR